jgi:Fur family transcriptional regulator, ferric uptake regulator
MKKIRSTNAKSSIFEILTSSNVALSQLEIQKIAANLCDRVTIYRILDRLVAEGKIHKIVNLDNSIKYASCSSCSDTHQHNHLHFSCEKCKSVTCVENVVPQFSLPVEYILKEINFTVSGICPTCNQV